MFRFLKGLNLKRNWWLFLLLVIDLFIPILFLNLCNYALDHPDFFPQISEVYRFDFTTIQLVYILVLTTGFNLLLCLFICIALIIIDCWRKRFLIVDKK